ASEVAMAKNLVPGSDRRRFTDESDTFATILGPDLRIEGSLRGSGSLELKGSLKGELSMEGLVWIRPQGSVDGEIEASSVVVEGEVVGSVHATGKVDLRKGCRVEGDITAGSVAAADGSFFEGRITMQQASEPEAVAYEEKRNVSPDDSHSSP
ncbi:MAG: polymer-forming cytoskeletal protein, partial [Thermoanaerobaculales bacterium]